MRRLGDSSLPLASSRGWNRTHWGPVGMGTHSMGSSGYGYGCQWVGFVYYLLYSAETEVILSSDLQTLCLRQIFKNCALFSQSSQLSWRNSNSPTMMGSIVDLTLEQHLEATLNTLSDGAEVA